MTHHFNDSAPQVKSMKSVKRVANANLVCCGIVLLLEMILVALPKLESMQYWIGTCNVRNMKLNRAAGGKQLRCHCSGHTANTKCTIYYPCIQILVSFSHDTVRSALVVRDRRRISEQCSYKLRDYDCRTKEEAFQHLEKFREKWGLINSSYRCFHSSRHPDKVILSNEAPSIVLALFLTIFPIAGIAFSLVMLRFKKQIALMILRRRRNGAKQKYFPLAFVTKEEDSVLEGRSRETVQWSLHCDRELVWGWRLEQLQNTLPLLYQKNEVYLFICKLVEGYSVMQPFRLFAG